MKEIKYEIKSLSYNTSTREFEISLNGHPYVLFLKPEEIELPELNGLVEDERNKILTVGCKISYKNITNTRRLEKVTLW